MKTWQFASCVLTALALLNCGGGQQWGDAERDTRMTVMVRANGFARVDHPVKLTGEFPESLRIQELGEEGVIVEDNIPYQLNYRQEVTFIMKGETAADAVRVFRIFMGDKPEPIPGEVVDEPPPVKPLVSAKDGVRHAGQESIVVSSQAGYYYYHKQGGGFASLIDGDSKDWISYKPGGRAAGEFRGIPNVIHPEGGLHPGAETCESRLVADGPLMVKIRTSCHDGAWLAEWAIYPNFAKFTMLKAAKPYWVLYEGTPGGKLDVDDDYWVRSDGTRAAVTVDWEGKLEKPRWVYFGDSKVERVLFLAHHVDDGTYDQFYQMDGEMTVFGFGREYKCCEKSLTAAPAEFTIGFVESTDHEAVKTAVEAAYQPIIVSKGPLERKGQPLQQ